MKEDAKLAKDKAIRNFTSDHANPAVLESKNPVELIIREGKAAAMLDAIKPNKVHLAGTIDAPRKFYEKRKELHDKNKAHVLFNVLAGTIVLVVDEQFESDNYKITGQLTKNPELAQFQLNTDNTFTVKELQKLLKFNRVLFADKDQNNKIVLSLQNFKAKVEKVIEESDSLRGDAVDSKIVSMQHELAESFVLEMPIFKGQPKQKFQVDILIDARSGNVALYLESRELKDLQMTTAEGILKSELSVFTELVCIEQ